MTDLPKLDEDSVFIIGAGSIGSNLARILRFYGFRVTLADPFVEPADCVNADVFDNPDLIKGHDYVVNTAPIHDPSVLTKLLIACIRHKVHYLDTNEDVAVGKFVRQIGEAQSEILFAPHCGLAPGLINVLGGHLFRQCKPDTIDLRVGALSRLADNEIRHTVTWSPEGFVNQYFKDFELIDDFAAKTHPSLFTATAIMSDTIKLYHEFALDGVSYECFPTSGGLGSMTVLAEQRVVRSLMYRTIRLREHMCRLMQQFRSHKFDCDSLNKYIANQRIYDAEDFVLIVARAHGPKQQQQHTKIYTIRSGLYISAAMTAIQKCTIAGVAAVMDLHRRGLVPSAFLHQHDIPWGDYCNTKYIRELGVY